MNDEAAATPRPERHAPTETRASEHDRAAAPGRTVVPVAALAFAFLVLRVFAVAGYDWNTAFLVSTTLGVDDGFTLLFGSLMAGYLALAVVLAIVLPLLIATWLWSNDGRRSGIVLPCILGLVAAAALTASFALWWLPMIGAALLGTFALIQRLPAGHRLRRAVGIAMARTGWAGAVALLLVAALTPTPWVPLERIDTVDGPIEGYVLSVDSGYLNVLTPDQRFVILISADVRARE